jgi:hypothetical protein
VSLNERCAMQLTMKNKIITTVILFIIISYVVYNVNYQTAWAFNSFLHRYYGKDNGVVRQIESTCFLSVLFYFVLATKKQDIIHFVWFCYRININYFKYER